MEAERNRRKQLLDTQAQINVAEGQKQRVILESEGHVSHLHIFVFLAKSPLLFFNIAWSQIERGWCEIQNGSKRSWGSVSKILLLEAQGEKIKKRPTFLRQQQALMEASAIAQQVENIARSLAPNKDVILPEHRQAALSTLVELKRLEQLRAIAESKSNSTYFFGDKAAMGSANEAFNVDYAQQVKASLEATRLSPKLNPPRAEGAIILWNRLFDPVCQGLYIYCFTFNHHHSLLYTKFAQV